MELSRSMSMLQGYLSAMKSAPKILIFLSNPVIVEIFRHRRAKQSVCLQVLSAQEASCLQKPGVEMQKVPT